MGMVTRDDDNAGRVERSTHEDWRAGADVMRRCAYGYDLIVKLRRAMWQSMKWTGAIVTVLLLVVWMGSAWCWCSVSSQAVSFSVGVGQFEVEWAPHSKRSQVQWSWIYGFNDPPSLWWWFRYSDFSGLARIKLVRIPIWSILVLTAV